MANSPNPDRSTDMMKSDHGTVCLATDMKANVYIDKAKLLRLKAQKLIADSWTI